MLNTVYSLAALTSYAAFARYSSLNFELVLQQSVVLNS